MTQQRWDELVDNAVGGPVTPGSMFGSAGLRTGKKFFAVWWHEQLVLKVPGERAAALAAAGQATPFEPMAGRRMNGWVVVSGSADWPGLTAEACEFVQSLQA
jgi:TfoX/Sxy family transcriptional regulator of competence genes